MTRQLKALPADGRKARTSAKFMRDCGSAIAVGGGTVALSFMISGLAVRKEVYVALSILQALLLLASAYFEARAVRLLGRPVAYLYLAQPVTIAAAFLVLGVSTTWGANGPWPANAYSAHWWYLIGLSLVSALFGIATRRLADKTLDEMEDERWRLFEQRVREGAPEGASPASSSTNRPVA